MRKILWIPIIFLCLVPIAFIGLNAYMAPPKDQYNSFKSFLSVTQQYIDEKNIDKSLITGQQEDDNYTRLYADYLAVLMDVNRQLAKEKNFMLILVQPRNLASGQSADVSLEKIADYDAKIVELNQRVADATQKAITDMSRLDKSKLRLFDVVSFVDSLEQSKPQVTEEFQRYLGMSQYIRAIIEFVKSRNGYYTVSEDGKRLVFSSPEDQAYYDQLVTGMYQYVKIIDDAISKRKAEDRKNINELWAKINES